MDIAAATKRVNARMSAWNQANLIKDLERAEYDAFQNLADLEAATYTDLVVRRCAEQRWVTAHKALLAAYATADAS